MKFNIFKRKKIKAGELDFKRLENDNSNLSVSNTSDNNYLSKLEFDPSLRKTCFNFFVVNFRVVILLIILLSAWGTFSFLSLPRESSPEVKIPIALVISSYPGASPLDVEELLTKKIETGLSSLKGLSKISSRSSNSLSVITVEFTTNTNLEDAMRSLQDEVNKLKSELPSDAMEPVVREVSLDDSPVFIGSFSAPLNDEDLYYLSEEIKDELEKISGVREVYISGVSELEIEIAYDPQKLILFGLSADTINQLVANSNLSMPAGNFIGQEYIYPIKLESRFSSAKELGKLPLFHTEEGAIIYLQDLAKVKERLASKETYSRLSSLASQPQASINIQLIKKTGASIEQISQEALASLDKINSKVPGSYYEVTYDAAEQIESDFNQLGHDFLFTLLLVFGILFLIVGLKEALVAGLAIPLVFFASFGVMKFLGISLNFLSLFSLILALGLLVDDAIVVVSATKQYLRSGKFTPEEAVLLVLNDFKIVLLGSTLTTVWAFIPLLMSSGIIGEFIKSIPITVSVTLIASLIIALFINHPLAAVLERFRFTKKVFSFSLFFASLALLGSFFIPGLSLKIVIFILSALAIIALLLYYYKYKGKENLEKNTKLLTLEWKDDEAIKEKLRQQGSGSKSFFSKLFHGLIDFNKVLPFYEKYLRKFLKNRRSRFSVLAVSFSLFLLALALPALSILESEFFPASDFDLIYLNLEAPVGLKLEETNKLVAEVENRLLEYPEIINFSTLVGSSSSGHSLMFSSSSSSNLASINLKLSPIKERSISSYKLADKIREDLKDIDNLKITVESLSGGPPSGAAFEARVSGDDLAVLEKIALDFKDYLLEIPEQAGVEISLKESPADYTFSLDRELLELHNLNPAYLGMIMRMAISGSELSTILRDGKEVKIIARFDEDSLVGLESIQNLQVLNLQRQPVFLKDLAKIDLLPSVEAISRVDQKRSVIINASIIGGANSSAFLKDFQNKIKNYELPLGYEINYGGESEQYLESVYSILNAMLVALILIIATLIIQFNSFRQALIVLVTIPLALIGVFFGLSIFGISLSFPGLVGILALFGIVVKNAIILIDKINLNIKNGIDFFESIVDAGKSRLEAIFITSISTIFGLLPITLSSELWRALGGSIIFGLMLSSFLTLFVVPVLYMSLVKDRSK